MNDLSTVIGPARLAATRRILDRLVHDESVVLEVGATDASFRDIYPGTDWTTVDKHGRPDIVADLDGPDCSIPVESGTVDAIICTEVLEHLVMGTPLIREMARLLRPTGTAIISVPNIVSLKSRVKVLAGRLPNLAACGDSGHDLGGVGVNIDGNIVGGHVIDYNERRLVGHLRRGGLEVSRFAKVPVTVPLPKLVGSGRISIPGWMYPRSFADFILVEARLTHPRHQDASGD